MKGRVCLYNLAYFNINKGDIKVDLSKYVRYAENTFEKRRKLFLLEEYETIEDYVYILYWLRFEKKLGYKEIGKMLSPNNKMLHNAAYRKYFDLGWNYSKDFNEVERKLEEGEKYLNNFYEKSKNINIGELGLPGKDMKSYNILRKKFLKLYKNKPSDIFEFKSAEKYFDTLFYLTRIVQLPPSNIGRIFSKSDKAMFLRLRILGLNTDKKTAQENAVKFNRRNYKNTITTGRQTLNKALLESGQYGSNLENLVRNEFASYIVNYIGYERYEVIVGINNKNIIPPKEVDIPIVIIDMLTENIFKCAIEFNAEFCHKTDNNKDKLLNDKGWKLFTVWQFSSTKTQKEYGIIEDQIRDICKEIADNIIEMDCIK